MDLGSGVGRLVFSAAALHPSHWKVCRGVELLSSIHQQAVDKLESFRQPSGPDNYSISPAMTTTTTELALAPIELVCGSFDDPYIYIGDADCILSFPRAFQPIPCTSSPKPLDDNVYPVQW